MPVKDPEYLNSPVDSHRAYTVDLGVNVALQIMLVQFFNPIAGRFGTPKQITETFSVYGLRFGSAS